MSTTTESKFGYQLIPLDQLVESKTNPRKIFRGVEELAESLKAPTGLIEPIVVRPLGKKMEIIAGAMKPGELTGVLVETALVSHLSANSNWSDSLKTPQDLLDCAEIFGVDHHSIRDELKAKYREQDKAREAKEKGKAATATK